MSFTAQVMSDLHLDFHKDGGLSFVNSIKPLADNLIIAGDLAEARYLPQIEKAFQKLVINYNNVYWIYGNHEFYGSSYNETNKRVGDFIQSNPLLALRVFYGHRIFTHLKDCHIIGATLWTNNDGGFSHKDQAGFYSDFSRIKDFGQKYLQWHENDYNFIHESMKGLDRNKTILITHHGMSFKGQHPKWNGSILNSLFFSDYDWWIKEYGPKYIISGHTHDGYDIEIGDSRLICNPLGYPMEHNDFNDSLVIEV